MTTLLPFQKSIIEELHSPTTSDLLILARGLGLRKILCTLLKIYDGPQNLILLVGAAPEEEAGIGEELGVMGVRRPGLRVVDYEMGKKDRQDLYRGGGLISVTSRILVVDMLQHDIPTELVTGIVILHAEKVSATSLEAFIIRLYRQDNQEGFLKAFSDEPEHFTYGFSPLRAVMKELRISSVRLYPRFHEQVQESLKHRQADVIELYQPLNESMTEIHRCIVECMEATLSEIKRSHSTLDLDDVTVENAYFKSFDFIIRKQLDSVWHRVGARTNQLVKDLAELRRLLKFLLSYPPVTFLKYYESIIASNTITEKGDLRQHQSPWLYMDAASSMLTTAKARCYIMTKLTAKNKETEDEDAWEVLDEWEGRTREKDERKWLPEGMEPVLEELPKWDLLAKVLLEIEEAIVAQPFPARAPGTNLVLIMVNDNKTCALLREYLTSIGRSRKPGEAPGAHMLEDYLKDYIFWKGMGLKSTMAARKDKEFLNKGKERERQKEKEKEKEGEGVVSEALRKKDERREAAYMNRRRQRGGKAPEPVGRKVLRGGAVAEEGAMEDEAVQLGDFLDQTHASPPPATQSMNTMSPESALALAAAIDADSDSFDTHFGLLADEQVVLVRPYADDGDDMLLAELKPRWIVMYEPSQAFIRRVEVYRGSNPGLAVRVYFMVYLMTSEDHMYLAAQRREKDAFQRLITERATMLNPILEAPMRMGSGDLIKTISSRIAGGGKVVNSEPTRVIVDVREFRSSLPSMLHAANVQIIPATLTVGDYILTPEMCVERKSVPDLVQSFNSGRLYTQCELMSVHYKQPILLIEFEQDKSFSLQTISDTRSHAKPVKPGLKPSQVTDTLSDNSIQSKLVLLTLAFPRLRIIWSSSPYATADIFLDLKTNHSEPDVTRAISIGAEEGGAAMMENGWNTQAEDLLRSFPGITSKNVRYVMGKVGSVRELCTMSDAEVQDLLGVEPGKQCFAFLHRGSRRRENG